MSSNKLDILLYGSSARYNRLGIKEFFCCNVIECGKGKGDGEDCWEPVQSCIVTNLRNMLRVQPIFYLSVTYLTLSISYSSDPSYTEYSSASLHLSDLRT